MTALAAPARFLHIVEALLCAAVAALRIRRGFAALKFQKILHRGRCNVV